ncbi:MAG: class I SAM-dependent DNA methyltransferase [Chthoniobacterales bacterium]|nr:class I SAM-dependent DNA methyltransferase [Chthoniobacterales bacterium]
MSADPRKIAISEHQRWLGYLQPEGLVVSPVALVDSQVQIDQGQLNAIHARLLESLDEIDGRPVIADFVKFAREFLGWEDELLSIFSVSDEVPDALKVSTGEEGELLAPTAAYRFFQPAEDQSPWLLLAKQLPPGTDLDAVPESTRGWSATPQQKFERLLRETGVPIGILCNGDQLRLVYVPKGENAGSITFPIGFLADLPGRVAAVALEMLLSHRRLITVPAGVRLPDLLKRSRDYQANVSTELSGQVLEALYELARGFQAADEKSNGQLLSAVWERDPQEIYGGLVSTLLRLVFLLYAEDRGLMPSGELYQRNYSVGGLFDQLRADHQQHPDTMDNRFVAWPRLLTLFRAVHKGSRHPSMRLPARRGHLFDYDRYPYLEGRASRTDALPEQLPRLSDGAIYRILNLLLYLDGERLSYRTLDVEQIGSVYETIMGFEVQKAPARMIALKPAKAHGAPVHVSLEALLESKPADRAKFLAEVADAKIADKAATALKDAGTAEELLAALGKRIDVRATPHPVAAGSIILQPTDERRRSGSHYTPRSFTEPIVRKTLEPVLDRLGRHPKPEDILDLKVADIAVGSAAFLVETARQLADELVASWHFHKCVPRIPPDEDELLYARRLIAQRCLYGVDRNPMAVDLAKLSLWLATMAKDHPFTFLDHAIKCGDSLVGLTNKQIAAFHWDLDAAKDRVLGQDKLEAQISKVSEERKRILDFPEDTEAAVLKKRDFLVAADGAAEQLRHIGDLVIAAFFAGSKPRERQQLRDEYLQNYLELLKGDAQQLKWKVETLNVLYGGQHPVRPFHWEIEFPEVFSRANPGFDAIVGNPPFAGHYSLSLGNHTNYPNYLRAIIPATSGKCDLVAFFFRAAFALLRDNGCFGLIATNTIAQGDTRYSGLTQISLMRGEIYAARSRVPWPGDAAVQVSTVCVSKGILQIQPILDGVVVRRISAFLKDFPIDEDPKHIAGYRSFTSFQGCVLRGNGFLFDDANDDASPVSLREKILEEDPSYERVIPQIISVDYFYDDQQPAPKYAIYFSNWEKPDAEKWPAAFRILEDKVLPYRHSLTAKSAEGQASTKWWQFNYPSSQLHEFLEQNGSIFCIAKTSSTFALSKVKAGRILSQSLIGFTTSKWAAFAILQCRSHETWTRFFASSLEDRQRYTPSDCFETFAFPADWDASDSLEQTGKRYYEFRADLMVRNNEGLTKTYNRFHDPDEQSPDITKLRELHAAMDRAVLDAYGWSDIPTDCQFLLDYEEEEENSNDTGHGRQKKKPWRYRWPDEVRDEVLARLLALNAQRHAEEVAAGLAPGMEKPKATKQKKAKPKAKASSGQQDLELI